MKYDVYSFGVLLLQIISGKRSTRYHGPSESMHILEYVSYSKILIYIIFLLKFDHLNFNRE